MTKFRNSIVENHGTSTPEFMHRLPSQASNLLEVLVKNGGTLKNSCRFSPRTLL